MLYTRARDTLCKAQSNRILYTPDIQEAIYVKICVIYYIIDLCNLLNIA